MNFLKGKDKNKPEAIKNVKALNNEAAKIAEKASGLAAQIDEQRNIAKSSNSAQMASLVLILATKLKDALIAELDKANASVKIIEEIRSKLSTTEETQADYQKTIF